MLLAVAAVPHAVPAQAQDLGGHAEPSSTSAPVVNCYDEQRDVVGRELASQCQGRVVSDTEAKEITERRSHAVARAIGTGPAPTARLGRGRIGTGFFVDKKGTLLTNDHVVSGCKGIMIEPAEGASVPGRVMAEEAGFDMALVEASVSPPAIAQFRPSGPPLTGALVATVGFPDQGVPPREPLVTPGTLIAVKDLQGKSGPSQALVMKAEVRHGNSGGPILDEHGLVIGMMRAKLNVANIYAATGKLPDDLGIGIPDAILTAFMTAHSVPYSFGERGGTLDAARILEAARPYTARVLCAE